MLRRILPMLAVLTAVGLLVGACSGDAVEDAADDRAGTTPSTTGAGRSVDTGGDEVTLEEPADAGDADDGAAPDADEAPEESGTGADEQGEGGGSLPPTEPPPGDHVIKEGTITVEVEAFDEAFRAVVDAAARLGGTVVASTSSTEEHGTSGSVTVRVPVDDYEGLLTGLDDIGEIVERNITARDVTTEFTDLESRLRHLRAQERFYLELIEEAESVSDAVTVRQQLDGLQSDIEQVQGRLQLLEDRTTYSTLTVELVEPDAPLLANAPGARPTLAEYWERARDAFTNVVGVMLVSAFFLAPFVLPAALAFVGWRALRGRPTPAVADRE